MRLLTVCCTTLALTLALNSVHADVTILGKPQLGAFGSIQGAVDAASQGDVLEVCSGVYAGFVIHNKALTVIGQPGGWIEFQGTCEVRALGPARVTSLIERTVPEQFAPRLRCAPRTSGVRQIALP